jgi:uncharacterized protein (DUF2147 family)
MRSFVMQFSIRVNQPVKSIAIAMALAMTGTVSAVAQPLPREAGVWIDDTGRGAVLIEPCGQKLCGRIYWLKDLVNARGEILRDRYNPDPSMRDRLICGLPVLGQLAPMSEGGYDGGWVYDPKVGKAFDVAIDLTSADELTVTGYKGIRLFGKSFVWTRAKTELPNCAEDTARLTGAAAPAAGSAAAKPQMAGKPAAKKAVVPASNLGAKSKTSKTATGPSADTKTSSAKTAASKSPQKAPAKEVLPWTVARP